MHLEKILKIEEKNLKAQERVGNFVLPSPPIKHILVPYDDSPYSDRAVVYALDIAKKYGAKVTILSVMYKSYAATDIKHQTTIDKGRIRIMEKSFSGIKDSANRIGIQLETKMIMDSAIVDNIVSYATNHQANLIIMGTRGRGGPKRLMFGSVAMNVSQTAKCPVMLVK